MKHLGTITRPRRTRLMNGTPLFLSLSGKGQSKFIFSEGLCSVVLEASSSIKKNSVHNSPVLFKKKMMLRLQFSTCSFQVEDDLILNY